MERDVVVLRQLPGDSTALWGAERLSEGTEVISITAAAVALPARVSGPGASTHAPEGAINHLAPGSNSVERSPLGRRSSAIEDIHLLLNCFLTHTQTHTLACRKHWAQQLSPFFPVPSEVSSSVITALYSCSIWKPCSAQRRQLSLLLLLSLS